LLMTKLIVKIYKMLDVNIEMRTFFAAPTVRGSAMFIEAINLNETNSEKIETSDFEEGEF